MKLLYVNEKTGLQRRLSLSGGLAFVATSLTWFSPATAMAQEEVQRAAEGGGGVFPWIVTLGVILLVCAGAFLNPKRSHLD